MAAKLDAQLEKLLKFSGLKFAPKAALGERVERTVEFFLSNCDILVDKVEQFGETRKKVAYVPKSDVRVMPVSDQFAHVRARAQNDPHLPFIPLIREKPFGVTPLPPDILKAAANPAEFFRDAMDPSQYVFRHPYETEIQALAVPTFRQLETVFASAQLDRSLTGKFSFVDTEEALQTAIQQLSAHRIVSVDLEFHLEHSFLGFTCLIQLSVDGHDFVIDPLPLFDRLWTLNFVFANPNILKVFHGSDADLMMLQKDFGVYVVNFLDTHRLGLLTNNASNALGSLLQSPHQRLLQTNHRQKVPDQ